jgi:hypothetical protein
MIETHKKLHDIREMVENGEIKCEYIPVGDGTTYDVVFTYGGAGYVTRATRMVLPEPE